MKIKRILALSTIAMTFAACNQQGTGGPGEYQTSTNTTPDQSLTNLTGTTTNPAPQITNNPPPILP